MSSRDIIAICQRQLQEHSSDCSGFVRAVAGECGVLLVGDANAIVDSLSVGEPISDGPAAAEQAAHGKLVIAGKAARPHGHVVVVVPGPLAHGKYPYAFWGQYKGLSIGGDTINVGFTRGHGTLNFAYGVAQRDSLVYASFQPLPLLMPKAQAGEGYLLYR